MTINNENEAGNIERKIGEVVQRLKAKDTTISREKIMTMFEFEMLVEQQIGSELTDLLLRKAQENTHEQFEKVATKLVMNQ